MCCLAEVWRDGSGFLDRLCCLWLRESDLPHPQPAKGDGSVRPPSALADGGLLGVLRSAASALSLASDACSFRVAHEQLIP